MKDALLEEFVSEIEEMLESCMSSFLSLEQEELTKTSPHVQNIMRYLHSAKGGCSMFDFPKLSHGFHTIEDLFLSWVSSKVLPAGGINYVFYFIDQARSTLRSEDARFELSPWSGDTESSKTAIIPPQPTDPSQVPDAVPMVTPSAPLKAADPSRSLLRNSIQSSISSKLSHQEDFNSELLVYIVDSDHKNILTMVKTLRQQNFLTKNFSNITRAMMGILEDHPDVMIINSCSYDFSHLNLVADLQRKKIPIPVIILDQSFTSERLKGWLKIGIKTVISNPTDIDLIVFKCRSHARAYRSQKLLNDAINLAIYQLGVINYPKQTLIPEQNLEELKECVKLLIKAKKEFSDLG